MFSFWVLLVLDVFLLVSALVAEAWSSRGIVVMAKTSNTANRIPIVFCRVIVCHASKNYKTNVRQSSNRLGSLHLFDDQNFVMVLIS